MRVLIDSEIQLRDWEKGDQYKLTTLANNPHIAENMLDSFPNPYTLKDAAKWIDICQNDNENVLLAIEYNGNLIGGIGGHFKEDVHRYNVELGYWIAENHWGKGITSKIIEAFCYHLFSNYKINRIYAEVFSSNKASSVVLEKNGFKQEALLKKAAYKNGFFIDLLIYSKLKKKT